MQRVIFLLGAVYDIAFGIAIVSFPRPAFDLFHISYPESPIYVKLCGIFLLMLGWIYTLYVLRPKQYGGLIPVAILGRFSGALLFTIGVPLWGISPAFYLLASGDGTIALLHLTACVVDQKRENRGQKTGVRPDIRVF